MFGTPSAVAFDAVAQVLSLGAQGLVAKYSPQVRMLDVYSLFAVSVARKGTAIIRMYALKAQTGIEIVNSSTATVGGFHVEMTRKNDARHPYIQRSSS